MYSIFSFESITNMYCQLSCSLEHQFWLPFKFKRRLKKLNSFLPICMFTCWHGYKTFLINTTILPWKSQHMKQKQRSDNFVLTRCQTDRSFLIYSCFAKIAPFLFGSSAYLEEKNLPSLICEKSYAQKRRLCNTKFILICFSKMWLSDLLGDQK